VQRVFVRWYGGRGCVRDGRGTEDVAALEIGVDTLEFAVGRVWIRAGRVRVGVGRGQPYGGKESAWCAFDMGVFALETRG